MDGRDYDPSRDHVCDRLEGLRASPEPPDVAPTKHRKKVQAKTKEDPWASSGYRYRGLIPTTGIRTTVTKRETTNGRYPP